MQGTLYLVATPIGNYGDISPRCAAVLSKADFIAVEHEDAALKLLRHLGIIRPIIAYYGRNSARSGEEVLARLIAGQSCALVTDAGTPAISDPGEELVRLCSEAGIKIISIPGPCAAVAAIAASGLSAGRFTFEGFLSRSRRSRFEHLNELKGEKRTMVFYEAPQKLKATLEDMLAVWGDRRVSIARELTKPEEERLVMTLAQAVEHFTQTSPKGEFVLVIEGANS